MPEESAAIRVDFPELDAKINQLKELLGVLQELQGVGSGFGGGQGGIGGGINPKTLPGTTIASPPTQSLPATMASQAAATAGTAGVAQQVGQQVAGSAPTAPTTPAPSNNPSQPGGDGNRSLYEMLGGAAMVSGFANVGGTVANYYATRATNVGYVSPYQAVSNSLVPSFAIAGAAIGSLFPGAGTLIGAGIGAGVGMIANATYKPYADLADAQAHYAQIGVGGMLNNTDLINATIAQNMQGRIIAPEFLSEIEGRGGDEMFLSEKMASFGGLRYSRASIRAFGADARRDSNRAATFEGMADKVMEANLLADPMGVMSSAMQFGNMRRYGQAVAVLEKQANLDLDLSQARADVGYEGLALQYALRYGSPGDVNQQAGVVSGFYKQVAGKARARAEVATGEEKVGLLNEARTADLQAKMQQEAYFQSLGQFNQAAGTLGAGTASRDFERALYSGAPAGALPWHERTAAAQAQIGRITAEMQAREAAGMLSPAMRAQYLEQLGQLHQQIEVGIPREREQMGIRQSIAGTELANTIAVGHVAISTARGSGMEQTQVLEARVTALQKEKELTDQILQTSRYLTNEERLQLQTRSESLKVQSELATVQTEVAQSHAREAAFSTRQSETRASARVGLLSAGTSGDITAFSIKDFRAAEGDVAFYQAEIARMEKFDPDNPLIQDYRTKLASARVAAAVQKAGLAEVPVSPQLAERTAQLRAGLAISQMGMGSFGDVRQNLRQQVEAAAQRVRDIDARAADLARQGIAVTPAMRAELAQQRAQAQVDMASLMMQYEEGWDQRLISQVYNAPGNATLGMSQFTHREAARAGVVHRAFGGSQTQTAEMRTLFPRMMGMLGSGDPHSFTDHAVAGANTPVNINLRIKLDDSKGTLLETGTQITKTKTGTDVNVNESSRRRPSG